MANYPIPVKTPIGGYGGYAERFAGRPNGGILAPTWDLKPLIRLLEAIGKETQNADAMILEAHTEMALWVQHHQALALQDAVKARGREQKDSKALVSAVLDDRSRSVNVTGFTTGYLDRIQEVELYWRRIEEGSSTQVGQVFYGLFRNKDDQWRWPTKEGPQTDLRLIKFGDIGALTKEGTFTSYGQRAMEGTENTGGRTPVITIGKAIPAYRYLSGGFRQYLTEEGAWPRVMGFYAEAFGEAEGGFLGRWARRYSPPQPYPALITKHYGGG